MHDFQKLPVEGAQRQVAALLGNCQHRCFRFPQRNTSVADTDFVKEGKRRQTDGLGKEPAQMYRTDVTARTQCVNGNRLRIMIQQVLDGRREHRQLGRQYIGIGNR